MTARFILNFQDTFCLNSDLSLLKTDPVNLALKLVASRYSLVPLSGVALEVQEHKVTLR